TITTTVPRGATTGPISVTNPAGAGSSLTKFTVDDAINTATHFGISAPASAVAGSTINVTGPALDNTHPPTNTSGGPVQLSSAPAFSSIQPAAGHTFVPADNGTFTFKVTYNGEGPKTITAAEVPNVTPMEPASTKLTVADTGVATQVIFG